MKKNFEVEVRGKLTEERYNELRKLLNRDGKFLGEKDRLSLIYYKNRIPKDVRDDKGELVDLRVRITNKKLEATVKYGEWGGTDTRKEININIDLDKFDDLINFLTMLGWHLCIALTTKKLVYEYRGTEFTIEKIRDTKYHFEAEILTHYEDIKKEMDYISSLLKELKLKPFTEEEHIEQCNKLNSLKDMHFDFLKQSPEDIKMKFKGYF